MAINPAARGNIRPISARIRSAADCVDACATTASGSDAGHVCTRVDAWRITQVSGMTRRNHRASDSNWSQAPSTHASSKSIDAPFIVFSGEEPFCCCALPFARTNRYEIVESGDVGLLTDEPSGSKTTIPHAAGIQSHVGGPEWLGGGVCLQTAAHDTGAARLL